MSGHLIHGQPTKKAKFHDVVLNPTSLSQRFQRFVKTENIHLIRRGCPDASVGILFLRGPTPTLICFAGSSLIDQDLPHGSSGHGQKVLPRVKSHVAQVNHPKKGFIGQIIGLQGDPHLLLTKTGMSNALDLIQEQHPEFALSVAIPGLCGLNQLNRVVMCGVFGHRALLCRRATYGTRTRDLSFTKASLYQLS